MKILKIVNDFLKDFCSKYSNNIFKHTPNKQSSKGVGVAYDIPLTPNGST
jgi:hypothetical protein